MCFYVLHSDTKPNCGALHSTLSSFEATASGLSGNAAITQPTEWNQYNALFMLIDVTLPFRRLI